MQLKKEVQMLSDTVKKSTAAHKDEEMDEMSMMKDQIRALEEGKRLCKIQFETRNIFFVYGTIFFAVTNEVISLRQSLSDSQLTAKEKEKLIEKAAQLAAENVHLKATVDEVAGQKTALEERIQLITTEMAQR